MAIGEAPINQCPPGGVEGVARLAAIIGSPLLALNPAHGQEGPRAVAVIDEAWCIGCTLCLDACPTDAIFGSNKLMHTVIEPWCTGCELCIPVCPVDCISLENVTSDRTGWAAWSAEAASTAKNRYELHRTRAMQVELKDVQPPKNPAADGNTPTLPSPALATDHKRAVIEAAVARAKAKLATKN